MWVSADRLIDKTTGMPYYRAKVERIGDIRKVLGDVVLYPGMRPAKSFHQRVVDPIPAAPTK